MRYSNERSPWVDLTVQLRAFRTERLSPASLKDRWTDHERNFREGRKFEWQPRCKGRPINAKITADCYLVYLEQGTYSLCNHSCPTKIVIISICWIKLGGLWTFLVKHAQLNNPIKQLTITQTTNLFFLIHVISICVVDTC